MLIRDVELLEQPGRVDVRVSGGHVAEVGTSIEPVRDEDVVDGRGGALLPGLHDHHLHVHALAAARASVDCRSGIEAVASAPGDRVRGVLLGASLDRWTLDLVEARRPVRVQHRSGALWMLNSAALAELEPLPHLPGVERTPDGTPTGRLWRLDHLLTGTWPAVGDLGDLGRELASYGVTGVTDATPDLTDVPSLPQHVHLLGVRKLLLHDHDLPTYPELLATVLDRRAQGRTLAVHCVTRESLLLTLAVLDEVGIVPGDRIEHGAVVPEPAALAGLVVVTQPAFVTDRAERYRREVADDDLPHLYRFASLLDAGVDVVASSDAPYGPLDPWAVLRAASSRDLGASERVPARTALAGYLRDADLTPRRVEPGAPADLVLLSTGLDEALHDLDHRAVRTTWIAGRVALVGPPELGAVT